MQMTSPFFQGGQSFVSGDTTPTFAAAAAISEAFDYHWWAAIPAYGLAVMIGVGWMGKDAHWASDILGSALVGARTTELLFYLHREREKPTSLIILALVPTRGNGRNLRVQLVSRPLIFADTQIGIRHDNPSARSRNAKDLGKASG